MNEQCTPSDSSRRRLAFLHTLGFVAHPGNAWVLARRALRGALGWELRVEKPGTTIHAAAVADWLRAAAATPGERFAFIEAHRRWVANEHGAQVLHATDRRHAADQTVAQRCVAVSLPDEDGRVLYQLARQRGAARVIEMGTAFGVGTRYLAAGMADGGAGQSASLWTIEADEPRQQIACAQLGELDRFVRPLPGAVEEQIPRIGNEADTFDLVFIDALHTFDATWGYYELIRRYARGTTFCIFHDVNSSWDMARVWSRIVAHPATREAASWRRLGLCLVEGERAA